jgi:hypothetical protein
VLLLAEIAHDLFWPGFGAFPETPADIANECNAAVAYLVRGVFTASQAIAERRDS